jgi:hypothetical protein
MIPTIGIAGRARHGKDVCAKLVQEIAAEAGRNIGKVPFALPLKARVYAELDAQATYEEVFHTKPSAVRRKLQVVGTEEGRDRFNYDLWTHQIEAYLRYFAEEGMPFLHGVVIPDVRFENEVHFARLGGRVATSVLREIDARVVRELNYSVEREEELLETDPMEVYRLDMMYFNTIGERFEAAIEESPGIALWISSDRPTLEGEAANHPSETGLDHLSKSQSFDGIITNNLDTTLEDLRDQLRPYIHSLLGVDQ